MTSTTITRSTPDLRIAPVAVATVLGTTAFTALGVFGDGSSGADAETGEFLVIVGFTVVAAAVVFGLVVPRLQSSRKAAGVGLGLSIAGLVFVLAFWSGLTPPLAVGGLLLGAAARRTGVRPTLGSVAMAVGALALVGYAAIYVVDWMGTNNIAGM